LNKLIVGVGVAVLLGVPLALIFALTTIADTGVTWLMFTLVGRLLEYIIASLMFLALKGIEDVVIPN
jgi:hypothetical protein